MKLDCILNGHVRVLLPQLLRMVPAGVFFLAMTAGATDGFWIHTGGGSWTNPNNWDSGDIADGADDTAYFGLLASVPSNTAVTLDGARTIGHLFFGGTNSWVLNAGSGDPLTLNATLDTPSITVTPAAGQVRINAVLAGTDGLEKLGAGTLILSAANSFSGETIVSGGTLRVNGMIGPDAVTVAGGILAGTGTILGPVTVEAGATLSPGSSPGTLTISNSLALLAGSTTFVEVNASTLAHDLVQGLSGVNYGGTLVVSNVAGAPAAGQNFPLFTAAGASGNFSSLTPQLTGGLRWRFDPASGMLAVVSTNLQPRFVSVVLSGGNLILMAGNGVPGTTNYLLAATNVTLPAVNWVRLATNIFDVSGNLSFTNSVTSGMPQRFFLLSSP